jgi:hypothetical protein
MPRLDFAFCAPGGSFRDLVIKVEAPDREGLTWLDTDSTR